MLAKIGHGMEVEVKRLAAQNVLSGKLGVPAGKQAGDMFWGDA